MTYSTELPEGFKTWNELHSFIKEELLTLHPCELESYVFEIGAINKEKYKGVKSNFYQLSFVKSKCYDEIMQLAEMIYKNSLITEDSDVKLWELGNFKSHFETLTHTKLFK